jgi:inhibitor of KinA sporulation pathway (predicted exonuclease)
MNGGARVLNVVDVEATCWEHEPPPGQVSEIIEIGLTTIDLTSGERTGRHRLLVRPARSTVSGFCTELTGLTQDEVDTGIGFAGACRILAAGHQAGMRPWASWGDYDRFQFQRQCRATGTQYPFGQVHVNAKTVFTEAHGLRKKPGMASALKIAGLPFEGKHHSSADDAWNIAALILRLMASGHWPDAISGIGQAPDEGLARLVPR